MIQGKYFDKKEWDKSSLPKWENVKKIAPQPFIEGENTAIEAYWTALERQTNSIKIANSEQNGFVSNPLWFKFDDCIYAHDTSAMVEYMSYVYKAFSSVESFDNFYVKQHENGEICRAIHYSNGLDDWPNNGDPMRVVLEEPWTRFGGDFNKAPHYMWSRPTIDKISHSKVSTDGLNDPANMARAEWLHYMLTGDLERIRRVLPVHKKFFESFKNYMCGENGLYITDWSSMDTSPRNAFLGYAVDPTCIQAYFAWVLADMCQALGDLKGAKNYAKEAQNIANAIQKYMWDENKKFFFDVDRNNKRMPFKTVAGFFPLVARATSTEQVQALIRELNNPKTFKRTNRIPSLAADEKDYQEGGNYYSGGVWTWTNSPVCFGLEYYGFYNLAYDISMNIWETAVDIFAKTNEFWEYYSPEEVAPGKAAFATNQGANSRADYLGFGATPVINYLLEYAIGLRPNAPKNTLIWNLRTTKSCGVSNYAFGNVTVDLSVNKRNSVQDKPIISVKSNSPFKLIINWNDNQEIRNIKV